MTAMQGEYRAPSGGTEYKWRLPDWSPSQQRLCRMGFHRLTRQLVVAGWLSYFTSVERFYCACGRVCWIRYEGSFVSRDMGEPDGHRRWIEMTERMELPA